MGQMSSATTAAPRTEPVCVLCGAAQRLVVFRKRGWDFVRCGACGLVSLAPLPTLATLEAHYDTSYTSGTYGTVFAAAEAVRTAIARRRLELVRSRLPPGRWLDVGASNGSFVALAAAAGMAAEGIELNATAVAQARARGLAVHRTRAETFAPPQRYAAVTAFDVIEHLLDPGDFVRRVATWLEPAGALALTVPNVASLAARLLGRRWFYYVPPEHVHYFTPATITRLLEDNGFGDVRVRAFRKPLTVEYSLAALGAFYPRLVPVTEALSRNLPGRLRTVGLSLPLGEMLVTARQSSRGAARDHTVG
jgi:SAM-dependent methyltransferase